MTDRELEQTVQHALDWEPSLDASDIGVLVNGRVVTLRGSVGSYAAKLAAERTAWGTCGVEDVNNDLFVHLASGSQRTDAEIAEAARAALKSNAVVPADRVTVNVTNGWLALKGIVDWRHQKDAAEGAVRELVGLKGVANNLVVTPRLSATDVQEKIEAAFKQSAEIDARRINVTVADGKIILSGNVQWWAERREAERAAWTAPGVSLVENRLKIVPYRTCDVAVVEPEDGTFHRCAR